ncbi:MAG: choice-of-anchor P family protein [Candidatus Dormibacteria bacterium]
MLKRVTSTLVASGVLAMLGAVLSPAVMAAGPITMSGRAFAVSVNPAGQGAHTVNDTGTVTSGADSTTDLVAQDEPEGPTDSKLLRSTVITSSSRDVSSRARVASVTVVLQGVPVTLNGIDAYAEASCYYTYFRIGLFAEYGYQDGYGSVASVDVLGTQQPITPGPNAYYPLPNGFTLVLDEENVVTTPTGHGYQVSAAHITGPLGTDIVIGGAQSTVDNC